MKLNDLLSRLHKAKKRPGPQEEETTEIVVSLDAESVVAVTAALTDLAEMVAEYEQLLKKCKVGRAERQQLLVSFQQATLQTRS